MKTRYKLMRGLCMMVCVLFLTTTAQAQVYDTLTVCDSYTWNATGGNGLTYNNSTVQTNTVGNTVYTLVLTVNYSNNVTPFTGDTYSNDCLINACNEYTVPSGDTVITANTIYTDVIPNMHGCDSTIELHITINTASTTLGTTQFETRCLSYEAFDGTVYTESAQFIDHVLQANGCYEPFPIDLTIYGNGYDTINVSDCDSFLVTKYDGTDVYYKVSGTYTDTAAGASANNCDQITTRHITIGVSHTDEVLHSCNGPVVWRGVTLTTPGTYNWQGSTVGGCDSTATVVFTMGNPSVATVVPVEAMVEWIDPNGNAVTADGYYDYTYTNASGCDSVVIYDVTIDPDIIGCMTEGNCNYDSTATVHDESACASVNPPIQDGNMLMEENNELVNWYTDADGSRWNMNDDAAVPQEVFYPVSNCDYYIGWVDANGCETFSNTYSYARMAGNIGDITTYPNPVKDIVSLEFNNYKNQNVKFELLDNNGNKVDEFITPNSKLDIDLRSYPSGVYYISFDSTNNKDEGCITQEKQKTVTKLILNK